MKLSLLPSNNRTSFFRTHTNLRSAIIVTLAVLLAGIISLVSEERSNASEVVRTACTNGTAVGNVQFLQGTFPGNVNLVSPPTNGLLDVQINFDSGVRYQDPQNCAGGESWQTAEVEVSLPSFLEVVSTTQTNPYIDSISGSGSRVSIRLHNDRFPLVPAPTGTRAFVQTRFKAGSTDPVSAPLSPYSIGFHAHYPTQGSTAFNLSQPVGLLYTKMDVTSTTTGPVGPGDEIEYHVTTRQYPHFTTTASKFTAFSPANADFVVGSLQGSGGTVLTQTASSIVIDFGQNPGIHSFKYRAKVRATLPGNAVVIGQTPTYVYSVLNNGFNGQPPRTFTKTDFQQNLIPIKPTLKLEWLPGGKAVALNEELPLRVRLTNLSQTTAMTNARLATRNFQGEGLATIVQPEPSGVALAPGESAELEYRILGTRLGKVQISGQASAGSTVGTFLSPFTLSPELCVGCADVELVLETPDLALKVGDSFPVNVKVTSNMSDPTTITFADPVLKEAPADDLPSNAILTVEPPNTPVPFELTPAEPTRTIPAVVSVNKVGVTDLVSSLTFTKPTGPPQPVTSSKNIEVSPLRVKIDITPRETVRDLTPSKQKTERCRELELLPLIDNCIEIAVTVRNTSDKDISNVNIPNADNPLSLINEVDPKILGEPLSEIEDNFPAAPVTLKPGAEATWIWRLDAEGAPAHLEFAPTVFGVMNGKEVGGHGNKTFKILENVLLNWGMRPTNGTAFVSGTNVKADGYLENVSADKDGEGGKNLRVFVNSSTVSNAGGGFVVPATYAGPPPEKYHIFNLPFKGAGKRVSIKALFNSLRTEKPSDATIRFEVRLWIVEDDGSLTIANDHALLDDAYTDEFSVTYAANQVPVNAYRSECLKKYRPLVCAFSDKFVNDAVPGAVGLFKFGMRGLLYLSEQSARVQMIEETAKTQTIATILEDEKAKNRLMTELHAEYLELHQQQVLANQAIDGAIAQTPKALEEFTLDTVDSLGRFIRATDEGDMEEIESRIGEFLGSNPDLVLEPIILMRSYLKLERALQEMAEGTADNVYSAAEQAAKRRLDGTVEERIAAAKARHGDPDLAKALLPGDTLTAKLLVEVFGVDQATVRRIQKIADEAGVIMAFRARSARASQLLKDGLAWAKPQALKQKCVNKLDLEYLGYRPDSYGKIEIMEPPLGLRDKTGPELQAALDEHMTLLEAQKPELASNAELRAEVRNRIEVRANEWTKYNPKLELYNPDASFVRVDVNFEASFQWARDMSGDIGTKESRKVYRNDVGRRVDPATGEQLRTWEIKMDGPSGQEARHITGDIDFLGILDLNGNFINDSKKRIAVYKAMVEAQLMEHGESMSARVEKAREEFLECCIFGSGEGMLTVGPWGEPRVGFFVDNRSVMREKNAAFKKARDTQIVRDPAGEIVYENGRPKEIVLRMEDPSGEFPLINGMPTLRHVDEALVRRFRPTLWETVWEQYFERKVKMFFPNFIKDFIQDQSPSSLSQLGTGAVYSRGAPIVRFEPISAIELRSHDRLETWTRVAGWLPATPEQVIAGGQPGIVDFAPYSVLREDAAAGSDELTSASQADMGATGDFFAAGDSIVMNPGGLNQETVLIASINPIKLVHPLQVNHYVGEMIAWTSASNAGAQVSGRVLTTDGRGLANAIVTISNGPGISFTTRTSSFGHFGFVDIVPAKTYVLNVSSKRFQFEPRQIVVNDDLFGIEITPLE